MDLVQPLTAAFLVLVLLSASLVVLKKRGAIAFRVPRMAGSRERRLEVVECVSLGPQHSLHLVRAGERMLLIATAPTSCQLLDNAAAGEHR